LARELLFGIEPRGRHATGMAWWQNDDRYGYHKQGIPATDYVKKWTLPDDKEVRNVILHTRFATQGDVKFDRNNHPIRSAGTRGRRVIGVHNGMVSNDGYLFKKFDLPKNAEVDSEVIMSMLAEWGDDWERIGDEMVASYAVAYLREDVPHVVHLARGSDSPLVLMQNSHGLFFASTENALVRAAKVVGGPDIGYLHVEEGRFLTVQDGKAGPVTTFEPEPYRGRAWSSSSYTGFSSGSWATHVWNRETKTWDRQDKESATVTTESDKDEDDYNAWWQRQTKEHPDDATWSSKSPATLADLEEASDYDPPLIMDTLTAGEMKYVRLLLNEDSGTGAWMSEEDYDALVGSKIPLRLDDGLFSSDWEDCFLTEWSETDVLESSYDSAAEDTPVPGSGPDTATIAMRALERQGSE
jgi:Glutamine amidotransferase domain